MSITFDTTLGGVSMTGFTSPIFDNVADNPPNAYSKQQAFTGSSSGTVPSGIVYHSPSSPFTFTVEKPSVFRTLGVVNPVTGRLNQVPRNVWKLRTRKGLVPLAGQAPVIGQVETFVSIPAGTDIADSANILAMLSVHFGETAGLAVSLGDSFLNGTL